MPIDQAQSSETGRTPFSAFTLSNYSGLAKGIVDMARRYASSGRGSGFASSRSLLVAILLSGKRKNRESATTWFWQALRQHHEALERLALDHFPGLSGLSLNKKPGSTPDHGAEEMTSDLAAILSEAEAIVHDYTSEGNVDNSPNLSNAGVQLDRGRDAGGHEMTVDSGRSARPIKPSWTPVTAQPKTLQITENERQYMLDLAPIIGRSPRAVKRFINCYRLAKAMLEPDNLEWFAPDDEKAEGNFHCTMFLLAMVSGAPEVATFILDSLKRSSEKTSKKWLDDFRKSPPDHDDWLRAEPFLAALIRLPGARNLKSLKDAADRVDRFAFGSDHEAPALVYWPSMMSDFWEDSTFVNRNTTIVIRTSRAGTESLINEIRSAIWAVNSNLPLAAVRTLSDIYGASMARTSFALVMFSIAGAMALLLGLIGIYGVMSYSVFQRTREIGIRIALGAEHHKVKSQFVRDGLALAIVGAGFGLVASAALTRFLSSLLFQVNPIDPMTYITVTAALVGAAVAASYLPARRATAVNPVEALRAE